MKSQKTIYQLIVDKSGSMFDSISRIKSVFEESIGEELAKNYDIMETTGKRK